MTIYGAKLVARKVEIGPRRFTKELYFVITVTRVVIKEWTYFVHDKW